MVDCAASIRAAGGASSALLTPRGLTAIYIGAADKYINAVGCASALTNAPAIISVCCLFLIFGMDPQLSFTKHDIPVFLFEVCYIGNVIQLLRYFFIKN